MRNTLDFLVRPPFIFAVAGKQSKTALLNKGFRPSASGAGERFEYWFQDQESATRFREAIAELDIYALSIF